MVRCQFEEEGEEETIQSKSDSGQSTVVKPSLISRLYSLDGGGRSLPESIRNYFEPRFGYDFNQVRLHTDSKADETTQSIDVKALSFGKNIVINSGFYSPETSGGKHLLAHELTHIIQQSGIEHNRKTGVPILQLRRRIKPYKSRDTITSTGPGKILIPPRGYSWRLYNFNIKSPNPKAEHFEFLESIKNLLKKAAAVEIIGHTSRSGTAVFNKILSEKRAENIAFFIRWVLKVQGIPLKRRGMGETVAKNKGVRDGVEREQDRAVDVRLVFRPQKRKRQEICVEGRCYWLVLPPKEKIVTPRKINWNKEFELAYQWCLASHFELLSWSPPTATSRKIRSKIEKCTKKCVRENIRLKYRRSLTNTEVNQRYHNWLRKRT